jgi:NAD(P)-dependent dehydrogenase (short-subunit alcohol dehydrogenase family)
MKQEKFGVSGMAEGAVFKGKRILITGGTSGLGLALLEALHAQGAKVVFVARRRGLVEQVQQRLQGSFGIVADVASKQDIHTTAMQALGLLGGLDVLINNASSLGPVPLALLADTECEQLELALATNVLGPFRLTRAVLGALSAAAREHHGGQCSLVLNISSDAALNAYSGWGAYSASKAALRHMSAIWDQELEGMGVRMLALDPGDMDTPLHALALPEADRSALKAPAVAAQELIAQMAAAMQESARNGKVAA